MTGSKKSGPPRGTHNHALPFWDWFLRANDISQRDFLIELERYGNPAVALEQLFVKLNRPAPKTKRKMPSGKRGGKK